MKIYGVKMNVRERNAAETALTTLALIAVLAGAYLPWIRHNAALIGDVDALPDILLPKMHAGIETYSLMLFVPVGAILALLILGRRGRLQPFAEVFAGVFIVSLSLHYLYATQLVGFDSIFVPAYGWYATIAGGLLLLVAGLVKLSPAGATTGATTSPVN